MLNIIVPISLMFHSYINTPSIISLISNVNTTNAKSIIQLQNLPLTELHSNSPTRFIENIEFLRVTKMEGVGNIKQGQILRNTNDTIDITSGYAILESNDGVLKLKVEANSTLYISNVDSNNKTITLYVQRGFIRATLNQGRGNPNRVIINTPGGYAAIRGTDISVSVNPNRVRFSMINDNAQIDDKDTLVQGNTLLRYANGEDIITELKEDYQLTLEEFHIDNVNDRYLIKAKTNNQNTIMYNNESISIDSDGIFNLNISFKDNHPIKLLTPLGTTVHFQVSSRGLI